MFGTCTTCLTAITEVDGIWYHDHGDSHGLAPHLARPSRSDSPLFGRP